MKIINIIIIITLLVFSQNSFSTGSDGGNSHPCAQAPPNPPRGSGPAMQLCVVNPVTGEEHCIIVNTDNNGEVEL